LRHGARLKALLMSKVIGFIVGAIEIGIGIITGNVALIISGALLIASSAATLLLAPKGAAREASEETIQLGEQPRAAVFGEVAIPGSLVDVFNYGGKYGTDWEVQIVRLADHKSQGLTGFYVNDTYVAFTGNGAVAGYNGQLVVYYRGDTTHDALPAIVTANGPGWSAGDIGASGTDVIVAYKADDPDAKTPVWPGGRPRFLWQLKGKFCYDPRKDSTVAGGSGAHRWANPATWEWTDNPIVCRYNWVRGVFANDQVGNPEALLVGRGLSAIEAPPENVAAAANLCDETVAGAARYRVDGPVYADQNFIDVEEMFASACGGSIITRQGSVEIEPGQAKASVATFTDDDFLSGSTVEWNNGFLSDADSGWVNSVVARYVEPAQKWTDHAAPVQRDVGDITADGKPREATITLRLVKWAAQAGRVAEIARRWGRLWGRATVTLGPRFCELEEGDWVSWTSARRFGGATKVFRVEAYGVDEKWQNKLQLRQTHSTVFSDVAFDEDLAQANQPAPPGAIGAPGAAAWNLAAVLLSTTGGAVPALVITGAVDDARARTIRFEYWKSDGVTLPTAVTAWAPAASTGPATTRVEVTSLAPGADYYAAVSYVVDGIPGDRRILGPVTAGDIVSGTFVGAGDLALLDSVTFGTNVYRSGGPLVTDATAITALGTAAGISGQGALATLSAAAWGSQVTGRPAELTDGRITAALDSSGDLARNITTTRRNASNLLGYTGGATFSGELAADVTSTHTASAISGQGSLATRNNVLAGTHIMNGAATLTLGDSDIMNGEAIRGGLLPNWNLDLVGADGKPAGLRMVEGTNNRAYLSFGDGTNTFIKLALGGSYGVGWPAIPIDDRQTYYVTIRHKSSAAAGNGLYLSVQQLNAAMGAGYTHIGYPAGGAESVCAARTQSLDFVSNAAMPGVAWVIDTYTYTPTPGTKYGTFSVYNYGSGVDYFVDYVHVTTSLIEARVNALNLSNAPAEAGANVTSTHTAAAISGQGSLATLSAAAWGSQVTGRPAELTDGRITAALDSSGDLARNITTTRRNASNLLGYTGGATFSGELTADVTSTHTASAITGQGSLATLSAAAWGSQVTGRPAELTDGRITAALDSSGDLARNITTTRRNASNLLGYTGGATFSGELTADVTSTHTASAISGQGTGATANNLTGLNATEGAKLGGIADGATAQTVWVSIGSTATTIKGNAAIRNAGNGDYNACMVAAGNKGSCYVSKANNAGVWNIMGLGADNTLYGWNTCKWEMEWIPGTSNVIVNENGTQRLSLGNVIPTTVREVMLAYDGKQILVLADGAVLGSYATTAGQTLYPKVWAYTASIVETLCRSGPYTDRGLELSGSGYQLGDSVALPANVTFGLIPSLKTAPTISDTDNTGTVTLNIGSAVHVPDSGGTVTFPSGTIAGKAYNTLYYVKRVGVSAANPTGTGWNASTTLTISVGDVYENYYTTRATGGTPSPPPPPPPGGGGQCVAVEMWIEIEGEQFRKAGDAAADWPICILDQATMVGSAVGKIDGVEFSFAPCVRIVTDSGGAGIFSETTPLTLPDGSSLNILEGMGQPIFVRDRRSGELVERWDRISSIEPAGNRSVTHIHAGGVTFAAGEDEQFMLMTHNYDKP
jgi:hypothetical protein